MSENEAFEFEVSDDVFMTNAPTSRNVIKEPGETSILLKQSSVLTYIHT